MPEIGARFLILDSVDSTNNYAMAQAHAGLAKHGDVYFAREQTAGRGQRGKTWIAAKEENITMSIVLQPPPLLFSKKFFLSAAIALACQRFFNHLTERDSTIKWPNDIYWRDRKAGGILIENIIHGQDWKFAIAGIGININQASFPETLNKAVSLKQITGRQWDTIRLAKQLCSGIETQISGLFEAKNDLIIGQYNQVLYRKNQMVKFRKGNISFEARLISVNTDGLLETDRPGGELFNVGEIEWLI
jgi:BirA family biotin operon repressor/biotin-[acetyl-CoA-carboxylase] ligase